LEETEDTEACLENVITDNTIINSFIIISPLNLPRYA